MLKEAFTEGEIKAIAALADLTPKQLINGKSQVFKKLNVSLDSMGEAQAIQLMLENPRIIIRPLLSDGRRLLLRFDEEKYAHFL